MPNCLRTWRATRATGGELLPFSRETQGLPDVFKEVAFSLKNPGDVSDPVEANGSYHLLQLIEKISPKAIKFEDVRDSVHQQLHDRWVTERMKLLREQLARKAMTSLDIKDPVLRQQFRDRITQRENQIKERDQIARELARQRELQNRELLGATDEPDAAGDTDTPATAEGELRPPATRSGLDTPDQTPTTSPAEQ